MLKELDFDVKNRSWGRVFRRLPHLDKTELIQQINKIIDFDPFDISNLFFASSIYEMQGFLSEQEKINQSLLDVVCQQISNGEKSISFLEKYPNILTVEWPDAHILDFDDRLFLKKGVKNVIKKEWNLTQKLQKICPENFLRPIAFQEEFQGESYLLFYQSLGIRLKEYLQDCNKEEKIQIFNSVLDAVSNYQRKTSSLNFEFLQKIPFYEFAKKIEQQLSLSGQERKLLYSSVSRLTNASVNFAHGDLHLKNIFYAEDYVRFIDLGNACLAPNMYDPTFFLLQTDLDLSLEQRTNALSEIFQEDFDLQQHYDCAYFLSFLASTSVIEQVKTDVDVSNYQTYYRQTANDYLQVMV